MNPLFETQKYLLVPGLIPGETAAVCACYAAANRAQRFQGGDPQSPRSHSVWGDFLMESLLETLRPRIEGATGLRLLPTYAFYRVYVPGEELRPHKDRKACEVSCTLCLGYDYQGKDYRWRIRMAEKAIALVPGDAVIYRGCEIEHSRDALAIPAGGWHAQAFLHYVDADGPNADQKFDGRAGLFLPRAR